MPQQREAYLAIRTGEFNSTAAYRTAAAAPCAATNSAAEPSAALAAGNQAALAARWSPGGDGRDLDHGDLVPLRVQEEQQQPSGAGSVGDRARGALVLMFLPLVLLRNQGLGARRRVLRAGRQQVEGPVVRGDTRATGRL